MTGTRIGRHIGSAWHDADAAMCWLHAGICGPIPSGLSIDGIRTGAAELTQPRLLVDADPSDYELYLTSLTCPGACSMLAMSHQKPAAMPWIGRCPFRQCIWIVMKVLPWLPFQPGMSPPLNTTHRSLPLHAHIPFVKG